MIKKIIINISISFVLVLLIASLLCIAIIVGSVVSQSIEHIDIQRYPVTVDYGILSQKQIDIFDDVVEAIENQNEIIDCPKLSDLEKHKLLTHLGLYYGSVENIDRIICFTGQNVVFDVELCQTLLENKIVIDARIDEAVSTLIEGSDKYKLWQISNYIANKITYTQDYRDTIDALNGKGVCNTYAMLFYKMATRIGIKTYICYGYANEYHAWNMVDIDATKAFYDITWYDNFVYNIKYLHSKSSWNRNFQINNKWSTDLKNNIM